MKHQPSHLLLYTIYAITLCIIAIISCNKKFDAPPAYIPPNITATSSIAALKAMHVSGAVDSVTNDMIIGGVVIANDASGNFYKQIIIQDSTGGIAVNIDDYNLYASFPVGRKVYVKLKGLYMAENAGLVYIGGTPDNGGAVSGIASRLKDQYIIKGETNVPVTPAVVSVGDLKSNPTKYMYMLVQFDNFEVKSSDTAKTYAFSTATVKTDANIIVKGCNSSDTMIIRTSGYCSFANVNVPNGNGTLTAVYAFYKSPYNFKITPQVIIRDTSDVQFAGTRCDGTTALPGDPVLTSIKAVRAMYAGSNRKLGGFKIGGVVISDAANKNISSGSVVLQDGDHGISVYFGGTVTYNTGDSILLDITGDSLLNYKGSLEIKAPYGTAQPTPIATGKTITPAELTIQQFNSTLSDIEYTLVKIKNATASGQSAFFVLGSNARLTDASGGTTLYTASGASFASSVLPAGAKDWVGYGNYYNTTTEFLIRNTNDITEATGAGGIDTTSIPASSDLLISEYVEGSSSNKYLEIFNAGSAAADLSKYVVKLYVNGSTAVSNQAKLDTLYKSPALPAGGIIIIQNSSAALLLPAGVIAHSSSVCNFNGDDAITLEKEGVVIDVFGTVGIDPGTSWTIAGNASGAVDHSIRRNLSVTAGNTSWSSSSATEWTIGEKDDISNLGTR